MRGEQPGWFLNDVDREGREEREQDQVIIVCYEWPTGRRQKK